MSKTNNAGALVGYQTIKLADLRIDSTYQRGLDEHHAQAIADNFDPQRLGPVAVVKRGDGSFFVVDGQHRTAALRRLGVDHALCRVLTAANREEEAKLFFDLNRDIKPVSAFYKFIARVRFKESVAAEIAEIVEDAGLRLCMDKLPGNVAAVVALEAVHTRYGNLAQVLRILSAWQADDPYVFDGVFVTDVGAFLSEYPGAKEAKLIAALHRVTPSAVKKMARALKMDLGGTRSQNGVRALRSIYNEKLRGTHRI